MKKKVRINFQNGLNKEIACDNIFRELTDIYDFEESGKPDFILFGPYGNDIPPKGNYTRIGYFCENLKPDLSVCEWAFGMPYEEEINDYRYKKIQWHDIIPESLIKPDDYDAQKFFDEKEHFCAFLYSHKVSYREEFFRQLSRYKKVDAPGISMNNTVNKQDTYKGNRWQQKQQLLRSYKFTIAFENYVYPGYQTEKLYDAMLADSIPIYCGDININQIFNTKSFVNLPDYKTLNASASIKLLEKHTRWNFRDIRPAFYNNPYDRLKRKLKAMGKQTKMNLQFKNFDFKPLIDRIVELDEDKNKYLQTLQQPWFVNNTPPANVSLKSRWIEIFEHPKANI